MSQLGPLPTEPTARVLYDSYTILGGTYDAASSFLKLFETIRKSRNALGTSTHQERDLLRAMLVFACAGLDSMIKQLVRDALESVIDRSEGAHGNFRVFVEKRLVRRGTLDPKFLSVVLTGTDPRKILIEERVDELTSRSLQSRDQVFRAASCFDIPSDALTSDISLLDEIFQSRNQIAHEMDVDLDQPNSNRRPRRKEDMIRYTKAILQLANSFLSEVDQRLSPVE